MVRNKLLGILFVITGYLLAVITMWLLGYNILLMSFLLGMVGMIIALIIQSPIQLLVIYLKDKSRLGIVTVSAGLGISAGFSQELIKYIFMNGKTLEVAVAFGLGIGLFEALYTLPIVLYKDKLPEHIRGLVEKSPWLGAWERYFGTLFHVVTAVILTYGGVIWLVLLMVLHGIVDFFPGMYHLGKDRRALIIGEILLAIITIALIPISPIF